MVLCTCWTFQTRFKMVVAFTERLLRLDQDERRREYRRQDFVPLEKIPTWRQENRCKFGCCSSTCVQNIFFLAAFSLELRHFRWPQQSWQYKQSNKESDGA